MGEIAELAAIYRRLVGAHVRSQLQYRWSFALNAVGAGLATFLDFAAILVIFRQIDALAGWSVAEVALLYGVSCFAFALTDLVIGHLDFLPRMIRDGEFDVVLIRPLGSLFQIVAADFRLRNLGKALQGLAVLVVALVYVDVDWTPGRVAMLVALIAAGSVIFAGVWITFATVVFWLVESVEVANAFSYGGNFLAQYPVNIFARWLRSFVVFAVPISFVSYFPALYVLDKEDPLGLPSFLRFCSPVAAVASAAAAGTVWRFAVRHYRSTGS